MYNTFRHMRFKEMRKVNYSTKTLINVTIVYQD